MPMNDETMTRERALEIVRRAHINYCGLYGQLSDHAVTLGSAIAALSAQEAVRDYDALAGRLCKALHGYEDIQPDRNILAAALRAVLS